MRNQTTSFGLVGYGAWGRLHAAAIAKQPGARLHAIVARSEASQSEARADHPGATVYPDIHAMLDGGGVDLVDIVTPSHLHAEVCRTALEAGCHVLLEKPMALNVSDCLSMNTLAQEMGLMLAIGHELRLSTQGGEVKRFIDSGLIGTPLYVMVELSRRPYRLGADGWRHNPDRVGSWVLEEPIHFFDLARWYLSSHGEPATIYATANSIDPARPSLHDNFSAIMKYSSGAYAVISQTLAAFEHHQAIKVTGTKGALWAAWSGAMDRTLSPTFTLRIFDGKTVKDHQFTQPSGEIFELQKEIAMCVRCLREGIPPAATGTDGLWSTALCLAAEESAAHGQSVKLDEFMARSQAAKRVG